MTMSDMRTVPLAAQEIQEEVVNDFSIVAATVNGSGSQTANSVLIRSIFKMGIPVNGKNIFPSNIAGLPTWYTIRVSKDGYIARRQNSEILVAFNKATVKEDLAALPPDGVCFYPDDMVFEHNRTDVVYYPLPVKEIVKASGASTKLRDYVANMVYVGAVAEMLGVDLEGIKSALTYHFSGKPKPIQLNWGVVMDAVEWVRQNLTKQDRYYVRAMDKTTGMILIDGNTAGALGSIFGGVTVVAWYPITPATSLADALGEYLPRLRSNPDGTHNFAIIQAEDELAALGMVVGAGWSGARAMTSTSGPGISLMTEFTGLAYQAEVPAVIWDIMRMGPSTGLPTRVSQADLLKVYFLGPGDARHVVLLPGNVAECFEFGYRAFDLAEELQTPVFVLSDLDLGMNLWMTKLFEYPDTPMKRGKVLDAADLNRLGGFARYKDVDGDGIGYRTLPGTAHPLAAYFTRGTGHNERAIYSERPEDWQANLERLQRKHDTARKLVPAPVVDEKEGAQIGIIAYGSADPPVVEARDRLRKAAVESDYLRLRALPFEEKMTAFIEKHERIYVVELSQDTQLCNLLRMEYPAYAARFRPVALNNGLPLTTGFVTETILAKEQPK